MSNLDYLKQLDLMVSAGEKIDIMMFTDVNGLVKRIDAGLVASISDFVDEEGIVINEVYNDSYGPIDDKYYGLPMKNTVRMIMMNKNHLDEAGLEIPKE